VGLGEERRAGDRAAHATATSPCSTATPEHHFKTGHIAHHSAKSLIFPLPAPGSQPKRAPIAWDPAQPYRGLGFREIEAEAKPPQIKLTEHPVVKA
jgi:hypothetical protein